MQDELTETSTREFHDSPLRDTRIAGRYEVREKLGSGGMATVYLAHDHKNAVDVAIKFMKSDLGGSARRRFFREFNTIAGIQHPCCLKVYEIGETHDAPYFTMELHPGQTVTSVLGDPPEIVAPMLVDLTLAVDYIHSQGVVHRDLKPSNVMVRRSGDPSQGRLSCKLADFGLAKFYQLDSSLTIERGVVGTPAYCAPEQIDGNEIDHRVDLYAVGILAFELLSGGRHPFAEARSQGMHALLHAQLSTVASKLRDINPNISAAVSDVVESYLAKEPDLRPSSALPLRRVLCEEYGITVDARLDEMSSPAEVMLNAVGFVCRERELHQVDSFFEHLKPGKMRSSQDARDARTLLLFTGEPGTGKTSTMQEAVRRAVGLGFQVYEGRCFDGSTSSFTPVIEIVRQIFTNLTRSQRGVEESTLLADYQASQSDLQRMGNILHGYRAELLLIAPELRRWIPGDGHAPAFKNDPEYIFRALATMFIELSQVASLCLCFDDIQWADNSTLTFLHHLAAAIRQDRQDVDRAKTRPIALMCTGRSGYASLNAFRERMETLVDEIELRPLNVDETRELLGLRLGCLPSSIVVELTQAIDSLCQGNPFFVSETIREWHTRGMIVRTTDGWQRVHSTIDEESSLPSTVRSALRMRINELSESAQLLVPAAAAIGRIVDLDLLAAVVSELDENKLLDAVDELLKKRVFVESNSASRVAFAHDLLRETVQVDLSASRRRALHRQIARVLEERQAESGKQVQPAILARHFLAGEMTQQAFSYLLDAAENANRVYAYDDAMEYLEQAEANQPDELAKPAQFRRLSLLAEAAWRTQQLSRAVEAAQQALQIADRPLDQATMHRKLGTFQCMQGNDRGAAVHFDKALETLGIRRSKWLPLQLASINFSLAAFHLIPRPILRVINRTRGREDLHGLACETMYEFTHGVATYDIVAYTDLSARNVRYSKALDSDVAKTVAYAKYGLNLGFSGMNARLGLPSFGKKSLSVRYGEMGVDHAHRDSRPEVQASCETSLGMALFCAGELSRAEAMLWNAEKTLRRCRGLHTSHCYHALRHIYSVVGDVAKVLDTAEREREVSASFNYTEPVGWAYYGLTHGYALAGRIDEALAAADESIRLLSANESTLCAIAYMEKGFALVQDSRYAEAVPFFLDGHSLMKKRWCFFEVMMPTFPRLVEALLGANWHLGRDAADCEWRKAKKYVRHARFFSLSFPNIRPHTWRSLGRLNTALGKPVKARKCFERAIEAAEKIGARYDRARALIDLSVVSPELADRKAEGWSELDSLGATIPQAELEYAALPPVSNSGARA